MKIPGSRASRIRVSLSATLLVLLAILWGYSAYLFIVSRADSQSFARHKTQGYDLVIGQLEQSALKTEIAVLQYAQGFRGMDEVTVKFDVFESKITLLSAPTDAMFLPKTEPRYSASVEKIQSIAERLSQQIAALPERKENVAAIMASFDELQRPLADLEMIMGNAEGKRRDDAHEDYARRREMLMQSSAGSTFALLVLAWLLISNARRVRELAAQQRTALQRETEAALAAANAVNAKNAFLGMIGHELRTPLQSIMAATDVLVERQFAGTDRLLVEQLARAADVLDAQMKDLTDFSRMGAGRLTLRKRVFNPYNVLMAAVESVSERAHRKGLQLEVIASDQHVFNLSDPDRIQQVVTNLLSNAIKYTEHGKVTIRASTHSGQTSDELSVSVEDTGVGIERTQVDQIFMPFTQLQSSGLPRYDGIGLGLAIVRGLVELLGAAMHVESEPGKGTTFHVVFPLEKVNAPPAAVPPEDTAQARPAQQHRQVLVVDDHEPVRSSLNAILTSYGIGCTVASDAREALEILATQQFDAILMDINMPGMNGIALAQEIRQTGGRNRAAPLIACSALAPELLAPGNRGLFEHYLTKPVRADILKVALDAVWANGDNRVF
ncbi:hybrid sensor histidine kinase/response regulator [Paraburkholderia sartisoli]|uniref:Virulence sensor protein BvgS n=1 Tax=Paraburkholderia sartisoli TaxID=83784 RepID=A0A1H3XWW6_9BURK|nr:ATP-binding protein [Paraburkholderia sartisoli]SEA03955.1 Signal transduction histidine kinase [Paraburkholderia sartisoli]